MTEEERKQFDSIVEDVIAELPEKFRKKLEEVPIVVEDYPSEKTLEDLGGDLSVTQLLFGLYRSMPMPDTITIYREAIYEAAKNPDGTAYEDELYRQIKITIIHEIGHHLGLTEDDLRQMGYG
jgi:predicted Zn-dependent protease with MMP-like domain